jgi:hypothetical protein
MLEKRVESIGRMKIRDVKYYSKIGVAIIRLKNEDEKIYLTNNIQSTVLDIKRNINISFNKELEFDFYIVLDQIASKLSTSEQVVFRLKQSLKSRPSHHSNFYFSF